LTVRRGKSLGKGKLVVQLDGMQKAQPAEHVTKPGSRPGGSGARPPSRRFCYTLLSSGENRAIFFLPAGKARLNAWIEEEGKPYSPRPDEDIIGDVVVRRIEACRTGNSPTKPPSRR